MEYSESFLNVSRQKAIKRDWNSWRMEEGVKEGMASEAEGVCLVYNATEWPAAGRQRDGLANLFFIFFSEAQG